jgi:hypothetical protein
MDADPDPAIFVNDLQDVNIKVFSLLLFKDTFTTFFKDKKSQRSHKQCCGTVTIYYGSGSGSGSDF